MTPADSPSIWVEAFSFVAVVIGLAFASPKLWKIIACLFLLLGAALLAGGWLLGFEAAGAAIGEVLKYPVLIVFLLLAVIVGGVLLLAVFDVISESPGLAIAALLLWFGVNSGDEDE